jgi:hypothetical protein
MWGWAAAAGGVAGSAATNAMPTAAARLPAAACPPSRPSMNIPRFAIDRSARGILGLKTLALVVLLMIAVIPLCVSIKLQTNISGSADFVVSAFISGNNNHYFRIVFLEFLDEFFNFHKFFCIWGYHIA